VGLLPDAARNSERVQELASYGCLTRMHVVRLLAPRLDNEDHTKDIDFSPSGIKKRWQAGYAHTSRAIEQAPWQGDFSPLDGIILHQSGDAARTAPAAIEPSAPSRPMFDVVGRRKAG